MQFKNLVALIVLLTVFGFSNGQETIKNIDSALVVLKSMLKDTSKVFLYQKIAGHYNVTHLDSAKAFAENGIYRKN